MSHKKHDEHKDAHEDDVTIEAEEVVASSFKPKKEGDLAAKLAACSKEKQEYLEGWQRAKADLINFKKDVEAEKKKHREYAVEDLITELIPALDSFDMAFRNRQAWESAPENWRKGIEHIYAQLLDVLGKNDVTQVSPVGETFDPSLHDSLGVIAVLNRGEHGMIREVIQKGYRFKSKLIRAPKVTVGEYKE